MLIIDPSRFTQSLSRHVVVCIVQVDRVTARRDDAAPEPGQHANDVRVSDWQGNRVYRPVLRCRRHRAGLDRLDPHCPALGRRKTGPPFLVLALVFLLWRRWGRRWWAGLVERSDLSRRSRPSCPSLTSQPSQNRPRCFPPHHDVHGGRLDAKSGHPGDERVSEVGERERVRECPTLGQNGVRKVADGQVVRACVPLVAAHC